MKPTGCLGCPFSVKRGAVQLRSCSLTREGSGDSCMIIECVRRPELGLFEPFRGVVECPEHPALEKQALASTD
ncbi:MAG TPA: hypothetical protein VGB32_02325 [Candidatus Bathyarchaeia archaeon]